MTIYCGTWAGWAQVFATLLLAFFAILALINARMDLRTSNIQLFATILKEISDEEASYDRGLVKKLPKNEDIEYIRSLVEKGRNASKKIRLSNLSNCKPERIDYEALTGTGIERTIARYDRLGFFLLGDETELNMIPPTWLWTHINIIYERLYKWITYRQTCEKEDDEYYHEDYAKYLIRLAERNEAKRRRANTK